MSGACLSHPPRASRATKPTRPEIVGSSSRVQANDLAHPASDEGDHCDDSTDRVNVAIDGAAILNIGLTGVIMAYWTGTHLADHHRAGNYVGNRRDCDVQPQVSVLDSEIDADLGRKKLPGSSVAARTRS